MRFGFQWNWTADQHGHLSLRLFASPAAGRGRPALAPGPCPTLVLRRAVPASATPSLLTAEECSVARTGRTLVRLPPVGVSTLGVTGCWEHRGASLWARASPVCDLRRNTGSCGSALALGLGSRARGPAFLRGSAANSASGKWEAGCRRAQAGGGAPRHCGQQPRVPETSAGRRGEPLV